MENLRPTVRPMTLNPGPVPVSLEKHLVSASIHQGHDLKSSGTLFVGGRKHQISANQGVGVRTLSRTVPVLSYSCVSTGGCLDADR